MGQAGSCGGNGEANTREQFAGENVVRRGAEGFFHGVVKEPWVVQIKLPSVPKWASGSDDIWDLART